MPAPIHAAQVASGHRPEHEGGIFITTLTASPKTPTQFGGLTLRPETLRAIQKLAWTEPTPIQTRVIPLMTEGRDLIGQAQTGSGKTGAYGIPLVERLDAAARALQALVLVPTRELARQTALFSATMPPAIRALAEQWLRRPVWVRIDAPMPTVETVEQYYLEVMEEDKVRALRRLLVKETIPSALVFRRTKHRVDRLARALGRDRTVGVLHGGMRQEARLQALRAFEERRTPLLITTNVASRGLDLPEVSHVINFDMPEDVDTYIHRVGR